MRSCRLDPDCRVNDPMNRVILTTIILALSSAISFAQNPAFEISRFEELIVDYGDPVDDLVVLPTGQLIAARTSLNAIGYVSTGAVPGFNLINQTPILSLALEYGPDGKLYSGDALTGEVVRFNLATGVREVVSSGYNVPIDLAFDSQGDLFVVDQSTSDFNFGPNIAWKLDLDANFQELSRTQVAVFSGAADIALGGNGKGYASSLGSLDLFEFDLTTGVSAIPFTGLLLPSDMIAIAPGVLAVSGIFQAQVRILDTNTGIDTQLAFELGGNASGAEDLAVDLDGNLICSMQNGKIYRLDIRSALRQTVPAQLGTWVEYLIDSPIDANESYALALSGSAVFGIPIPGTANLVPLDDDALFSYTLSSPRPPEVSAFDGVLDAQGRGIAKSFVPLIPSLVGFKYYVGGVTLPTLTSPTTAWTALNACEVCIVP